MSWDYTYYNGKIRPAAQSWVPTWLRSRLGDEYFHEVTAVGFDYGSRFTDDDARSLAEFGNLEYLRIHGTSISDLGFRNISRLTRLRELYLLSVGVTDAGLVSLRDLENLQILELSGTKVAGDGLKQLRDTPNLREINIFSQIHITDEGLKALESLRHLRKIKISHPLVWDKVQGQANWSQIRCEVWSDLRELTINSRFFGDEGLARVCKNGRIEKLSLHTTAITDKGLQSLPSLKKLQELDLRMTSVTSDGVALLRSAMPSVRILADPPAPVPDVAIPELPADVDPFTGRPPEPTKRVP